MTGAEPGLMPSQVLSANRPDCDFPLNNLPYGVFSDDRGPRCGVAIGDRILDLAACEAQGLLDAGGTFAAPRMNDFIARGPDAWAAARARLTALLSPEGPCTAAGGDGGRAAATCRSGSRVH